MKDDTFYLVMFALLLTALFLVILAPSCTPVCQPCTPAASGVTYVPAQPRGPVYVPAPEPPVMVNPDSTEEEYELRQDDRDDALIGDPIYAQRGGRR